MARTLCRHTDQTWRTRARRFRTPSRRRWRRAEGPVWMRPGHERYIVLQTIGIVAFGDVSIAFDRITNRRVAIKRQGTDSEARTREFACLAALSAHPHPNVSVLLDYYVSPGTFAKTVKLNTVHPSPSLIQYCCECSVQSKRPGSTSRTHGRLHDRSCG